MSKFRRKHQQQEGTPLSSCLGRTIERVSLPGHQGTPKLKSVTEALKTAKTEPGAGWINRARKQFSRKHRGRGMKWEREDSNDYIQIDIKRANKVGSKTTNRIGKDIHHK